MVEALNDARIEYMLTGSLVSSLQGEPRATHDIDMVISLPSDRRKVESLLRAFKEPRFYLDPLAVTEAIDRRAMFNLLDTASGDKVDFWLLTDSPFDAARFARARTEHIGGLPIRVSSPEDTILMKLRWAVESGGSEKQYGDALRVYEVQHPLIDEEYLDRWAPRLGVDDLLHRLRSESTPV